MQVQVMGCCGKYVQGYGVIRDLKKYIDWMGDRFLIVGTESGLKRNALETRIIEALDGKETETFYFKGECSWSNIGKLMAAAEKFGAQTLIGVGGGKVVDTVKGAALKCGLLNEVIIPTIAATDAYTSAASCIYDDDTHEMTEAINSPKNPDVVLVDTEILVKAPVRQFVSGMGDALSTYIGALVCQENFFNNHHGGVGTHTALAIAKLSYDMLMEYGRQAKIAAENRVVSDAYNAITEVNILMSGMGFENNGSSSDHCFYFGTQALHNREQYCYHGEGVAFSTCCQLVMQGSSNKQLDEVYRFCRDVGLPITFDDMHLSNLTEEEFEMITNAALDQGFMHNQPFEVTYEKVLGAYKTADAIGQLYHNGGRLI
jgi:glycerol dehydrogenase